MAGEITHLQRAIDSGEAGADGGLFPLLYDELRRLAAFQMARERPGQTLQPTALVHEAWMRLGGDQKQWHNRAHFLGAAAEAMRRILIDRARKRNRVRHGAGLRRVNLEAVDVATTTDDETLLRLNDALEKLAAESPARAELVKLRFFAGLGLAEAAATQGVSLATAKRHWAYARAWLLCELKDR
ncbi:MAG TPA: RNA polymerase subunit sigma [Verrucomicrobiales bacterium]|nr:RNA polymerase subunit sigma [Verrucomicrobiales bacterium]